MLFTFIGGVGLFLLGMRLMTDGLKVAAGDALREILARGTATTGRGILSGVVITAGVQSSSAVIFATIGFVNAGLLTLFQSVGVIIGSNIGTTATSWLVALVGFKVNLQALAMPAIAVGMFLRVTGGNTRRGALGDALTGFGIFFLGLDVLKSTFTDFGEQVDLERFVGGSLLSLLAFVAIGIVMTVVMNSSSAALAVTLTAAGSGLIPLTAAAAMVIGANIGTTSTALFAVIGATSSAKRAASAHVLFNLITGVVAFAALPLLLWLVAALAALLGLDPTPAVILAIFHTMTKLTGASILWPMTPWLVTFLESRFRTAEEDEGIPRHLDRNIAGTPDLALEALNMEIKRISAMARGAAYASLSAEGPAQLQRLQRERASIDKLVLAAGEFATRVQYGEVPASIAGGFPVALRITQYYGDIAEHAEEMVRASATMPVTGDEELAGAMADFKRDAVHLLGHSNPDGEGFSDALMDKEMQAFQEHYQTLKGMLLRGGAQGRLPMRQMVGRLDEISDIRRILDQAVKAAHHTITLRQGLHGAPDLEEDSAKVESGHADEISATATASSGDQK
ncbi:MAG: Na/Pi cotransporter family protein [Thiohalomonadaceae bacterium]